MRLTIIIVLEVWSSDETITDVWHAAAALSYFQETTGASREVYAVSFKICFADRYFVSCTLYY